MDTSLSIDKFDTAWLESLALEEITMESSGYIRFTDAANPTQLLEEASVTFMNRLQDRFQFYVSLFNQYQTRQGQAHPIKVFKIANTVNDFMMFRNSLKLIVARRSADVISIGFLSTSGGLFAPHIPGDAAAVGMPQRHELKAHVGPFNSITWRYQGEVVELEALVRFYLSEFVRNSAR